MPKIVKEDILKRVYFIVNLVQSHNGDTMQGALTSKSDSMGGIFDRFINSLSEEVLFDKVLLPQINTQRNVEIIKDYYLYKPSSKEAGIAPDLFGLKVDGRTIPFVVFDEKWKPIEKMPQIEVKTFKAKDQMVSLRKQDYDSEYLVLADLKLRIDYLVPFFDKELLNNQIAQQLKMDDVAFIKNDSKGKIKSISNIDFSNDEIGNVELITVTTGADFMKQATCCTGGIGPRRVKDIRPRKLMLKSSTGFYLSNFSKKSERINDIFEYTDAWYDKTNIQKSKTKFVDFSATNIDAIEICSFNSNSIVIKATREGCLFNGYCLENGKQYNIEYATLERDGNNGVEYFMQKECTKYLTNHTPMLIEHLKNIINTN